jgi:hypothetical protein
MRGPISTTEFDVHDAVALCHLPPLAITSPNVGWVPHPFLFEDEPVQARADGRFGTVNIYQWPQLYNDQWPWLVAIMQNLGILSSNLPILWARYNPVYEDFEPIHNSTLKIGFLKKETIMGLCSLFDEVRKCLGRFKGEHLQNTKNDHSAKFAQSARSALRYLERFPLSWCDTITCIAELQCTFLEFHAYCNFYQTIHPRFQKPMFPFPEANQTWMGAFTDNKHLAETLFRTGMPMWFVSHEDTITKKTIFKNIVSASEPSHIIQAMYVDPEKHYPNPFPI